MASIAVPFLFKCSPDPFKCLVSILSCLMKYQLASSQRLDNNALVENKKKHCLVCLLQIAIKQSKLMKTKDKRTLKSAEIKAHC